MCTHGMSVNYFVIPKLFEIYNSCFLLHTADEVLETYKEKYQAAENKKRQIEF